MAALLTYVVPQGFFETQEVTYILDGAEKTRTVVDSNSFQYVLDESGQKVREGVKFFEPYGEVGFSNYMLEGLVSGSKWGSAVGIVAFILVIGGAFGIILKTGAVEAGILSMIKRTKGKEALLIPAIFFLFSLGGAVFGMGEEAIPFAMILVPLLIAMGYDAIVGIMITYVATQIGFATSWMNPFSVAIAQGVSGVPVLSGAGFRIVMWAVFTLVGIAFTWRYANSIKKNPQSSIAYESDAFYRNDFKEKEIDVNFGLGHILVLLNILVGTIWVVWGVMENGYYIPEIATRFFVMGLVAGVIGVIFKLNNMNINDIASYFRDGAKDLVGVSRQVSVLAFQLGDGLTNLIVPTSASLMGVLGVAKLDWAKWAKWQIKFQGILFAVATVFIVVAVMIGY